MKTIISKLKLAAIAGIALITTFSINSCKKSSSSPGLPTVRGITLTSGTTVTAGTSTGFTITGVNLTGARVTTTASGVTITGITVTGTSITGTVAINASFQSGSVTLKIVTSIGSNTANFTVVGLPVLGGYISSDSIAAANLISYFTFNGNVNDTVGNQTGTAVGVTYVPGIRGMAYQGATGAYATVPASSAFSNLQSFSVSVWYSYTSATRPQVLPPGNEEGIFFVSGDSTYPHGNLIILEADDPSASQFATDSVPIHNGFNNIGGVPNSWQNFTMISYDTATSKWIHVVMTYDGPSSIYTFYENGVPIAVSSVYGVSTSTTIDNGPLPVGSGTPPTQLMGNLSFAPDPPKTLFIGTWPPQLYGVSPTLGARGSFLGAMDELRVYNVALTQAEVVGLYLNGLAGR